MTSFRLYEMWLVHGREWLQFCGLSAVQLRILLSPRCWFSAEEWPSWQVLSSCPSLLQFNCGDNIWNRPRLISYTLFITFFNADIHKTTLAAEKESLNKLIRKVNPRKAKFIIIIVIIIFFICYCFFFSQWLPTSFPRFVTHTGYWSFTSLGSVAKSV